MITLSYNHEDYDDCSFPTIRGQAQINNIANISTSNKTMYETLKFYLNIIPGVIEVRNKKYLCLKGNHLVVFLK